MGCLKWDVVKTELEQAGDKLEYVKSKLSKYDSDSKYAPAYRYLGIQILKYVLDCVKKKSGENITELVKTALQVIELLGEEEEVRNYVNKLAPHLIHALAATAKSVEELDGLCDLVEGLYDIMAGFGKQTFNNTIVSSLLKTVSRVNQGSGKLFSSAVLYLPLCADSKPFSNIATNSLILIRDMEPQLRSQFSGRFWDLVEWCLEQQITSRLLDLIFYLIQLDVKNDQLDEGRTDKTLELYCGHLSLHSLTELLQLVRDMTSLLTSPTPDLAEIQLPKQGFLDVFSTTHKETIWILLAISQHISFCLLRLNSAPSIWIPLIFHVCTLMYRSPQESVRQKSSELLTLLHNQFYNASEIEGSDETFRAYMNLQMLTLQNLGKTSISGEEFVRKLCEVADQTDSVSNQTDSLSNQTDSVSNQTDSVFKQTELLELATRVPGIPIPQQHRVKLASLYRSQGHISEAISLLKDEAAPSTSSTLLLVYCLLSKLECEPALNLLNQLESTDEAILSTIRALKTYCTFVTSLKQREPFSLPNPAQFCVDVKKILSSPDLEDCVLTILIFLAGLYGLNTVVARCAAHLSPRPRNHLSLLSSVPALLATRTRVTWSRELEILTSPDSEREEVEELWEETDRQTDKETDRGTEKALLCGVCGYVLLDKVLADGEEVYEISERCTALTLQAAHAKLKSWKRTAMSSRALQWQNCAMIPYTLHVLSRYISLLFTWGSVHQTMLFLDRLEQLAKFSRSDYWISRHRNLSTFVRVTLQTLVVKIPASVPECVLEGKVRSSDNEFLSEYLEMEKFRAAECDLMKRAAERSNQVLQASGSAENTESDVEDSVYPVFSSSLSPSHLIKLILLQLELSWSTSPPSQESSVECFHSLKTARENCSTKKSSKRSPPVSPPVELTKQSEAWLSVLADFQQNVPQKIEEVSVQKPATRRGRSRNNSNSKPAVKQTATRQSNRRQAGKRQTASKRSKQEEAVDHVQSGLGACKGLEPVFVKRELLKRKMKRAPMWSDVEEYHNIPFKHQIRDVITKHRDVISYNNDVTIPENWTFASILQVDGTLFLGQKRGDREVVFKRDLPFSLKSAGVGGENTSCLDEMRRIISSNDDSVSHSTDKVKFWKSRYQLNSRLEDTVERLESDWLGPWKGLLLGRPADANYQNLIKQNAAQLRSEIKSAHKVELSEFLSEYILDCYSILSEEHLTELLPGLPLTELLGTIHDLAPAAPPARHPTLLTLGPELDILPWESCKVYRNQPISRVPSTNFALTLQMLRKLPVKLKKEETFYILNPTQNLPSTQACFETWLTEQEGWRGVAAKPPSLPEYQAGLKSDMFLYLGHGSGKEFLAGKPIQELDNRAVALLMGCSSGKIKQTPVGGTGTPVEYLLSGCPAVLGYLWNITDRDCDRFSKKLLELWLAEGRTISLVSLINPSRDACKLPYLVGAAPVLYGVPDILTASSQKHDLNT